MRGCVCLFDNMPPEAFRVGKYVRRLGRLLLLLGLLALVDAGLECVEFRSQAADLGILGDGRSFGGASGGGSGAVCAV